MGLRDAKVGQSPAFTAPRRKGSFPETLLALQAKSLGEQEWRSQQLGVLGGHHFESDTEMSDIDDDDRETLFSSMDLLSPSGHSDAQTLAMMLQEQLDAINKEIRYPPLQTKSLSRPPSPASAAEHLSRRWRGPHESSSHLFWLANALIILCS